MKTLLILALFCIIPTATFAGPAHLADFLKKYPKWKKAKVLKNLKSCFICHIPKQDEHNPYGQAYFNTGWRDGEYSFEDIEDLDSDKDGYTNIQELKALTLPGDAKSHPVEKKFVY
ncbi:MAG: hypothetical protein HOE90_15600 [Bacteriovoracaceae bacterium]|jgi:hypothetical protein|nr:hypothetical protein [Bacteriovoracaceae bacterium]